MALSLLRGVPCGSETSLPPRSFCPEAGGWQGKLRSLLLNPSEFSAMGFAAPAAREGQRWYPRKDRERGCLWAICPGSLRIQEGSLSSPS